MARPMTTDELIQKAIDYHRAAGTIVRCPVCGAAEGFFCRVSGTNDRSDTPHVARLRKARLEVN